MSTYKELKEEFNKKVEELREKCVHPEVSDWVNYHWAIGHGTRFQVKVCKVCEEWVAKRTHCDSCEKHIEETEWIESDGKETLFGSYYCSKECYNKGKEGYKVFTKGFNVVGRVKE